MTRFVGILSHEPAVGKTTTAVYLALLLADAGRETLLIDLGEDLEAARLLGADTESGATDTEGHHALRLEEYEHLGVLRRPIRPGDTIDPLRASCEQWEFVIVDLPAGMERDTSQMLPIVDSVIVVVPSTKFSLAQIASCLNEITDLKGRAHPDLSIEGVLITFAEKNLEKFESTVRAVDKHFPVDVFPFAIPRDEMLQADHTPPSSGLSAALWSRGVRGYVELAMEVISHE